jgi:hypothetical protein
MNTQAEGRFGLLSQLRLRVNNLIVVVLASVDR